MSEPDTKRMLFLFAKISWPPPYSTSKFQERINGLPTLMKIRLRILWT